MHYWNLGIITYKYWFMLPRKEYGKTQFFLKFYLNSQWKQRKVSLKNFTDYIRGEFNAKRIEISYG